MTKVTMKQAIVGNDKIETLEVKNILETFWKHFLIIEILGFFFKYLENLYYETMVVSEYPFLHHHGLIMDITQDHAPITKTRLKRLPVIGREHFRKTRTNYFCKHLFGILNTNLQNGISNTSA
jgi:hypothetical protein